MVVLASTFCIVDLFTQYQEIPHSSEHMNGIFSRWIRQRIGDTAGGPLARHPISFSTTPRQNLNRSFVENFPDTTTIRRAVVVVFLIYSIRINLGILKPR